jgi:hypothetical protein
LKTGETIPLDFPSRSGQAREKMIVDVMNPKGPKFAKASKASKAADLDLG